MPKLELPLTGGCQCGKVRYAVTDFPATLYCCHCTECQGQAASAFGMSLRVDGPTVELKGQTASYIRDEGQPTQVECLYCPDCGTRLIHRRDATSTDYSIKAGSLDAPIDPVGHIWVRSKQKWVVLSQDDLSFETQPEDGYAALIAAFRAKYG